MKDLDKTQVYDLRGITEEQSRELREWLIRYDVGWGELGYRNMVEDFSLEYSDSGWVYSDRKPTTHISTLFEQTYEQQLQEAKSKLEHYKKEIERLENESKLKVGDVSKFWDNVENDFAIGILTGIVGVSNFPYQVGKGEWFKNAKKLTEKEVVDLLFRKS